MWKCTATFRFFCVWYRRYDILHVKNDQNSRKKSTNWFLHFTKNLQNSFINIFTFINFYKLCVLANIFCAEWIFLTCLYIFLKVLNTPTTFVLTTLLFQFLCLSSPMTPQSYCQYLKICAVKNLFLQYLPGGRNFSGLRVIAKIVQ